MSSNNDSLFSRSLHWLRQHKIVFGVIAVILFTLLFVLISSLNSSLRSSSSVSFDAAAPTSDSGAAYQELSSNSNSFSSRESADTGTADVEIKRGSLSVDSNDAAADEEIVRNTVSEYDGSVEEGSQSETSMRRQISLTTRVPSGQFSAYAQTLRDQLTVDDYRLRNYRVDINERTTELDIIADTSEKYAAMKDEAQSMPLDAERIELTMDITERQLDLKERENSLQSNLDRITQRGDMATLNVTLEERLSANIWPEDLGNEFKDELRETIQRVVEIAIAIVTTSIVVLMTALQWAIWLLIGLGVLWFAWRLVRRLYKRWYQ